MELKETCIEVGERRAGRLLKINAIRPVCTPKPKATTNRNHNLRMAPNSLDGDLSAATPNRTWAGRISYIWTTEGRLDRAAMLDLHSRRIVGWAVSDRIEGGSGDLGWPWPDKQQRHYD